MRTAIPAVISLLFLACFPVPAAAQSNSSSAPSHFSLGPEPDFMHKKPQTARALPYLNAQQALPSNIQNALNVQKDHAKKANAFNAAHGQTFAPKRTLQANSVSSGPCAHILIHPLRRLDWSAIAATPNGSADRMPDPAGLPSCREDVR